MKSITLVIVALMAAFMSANATEINNEPYILHLNANLSGDSSVSAANMMELYNFNLSKGFILLVSTYTKALDSGNYTTYNNAAIKWNVMMLELGNKTMIDLLTMPIVNKKHTWKRGLMSTEEIDVWMNDTYQESVGASEESYTPTSTRSVPLPPPSSIDGFSITVPARDIPDSSGSLSS